MKTLLIGTLIFALQSSFANADEHLESLLLKNDYTTLETSIKDANELTYWQGRIALRQNNLDDAEVLLKKAAKTAPDNADKQYWFGVVNLKQASNASIFSAPGYARTGKEQLSKALSIEAEHTGALSAMFEYMLHAPAIVGGSTDKAKMYAEKLAGIDKSLGAIHFLKLFRKLRDKTAEQKTATSIFDNSDSSASAILQAGFSFQRLERFEAAHHAFSKASRLASDQDNYVRLQSIYQIGKTAMLSETNISEGIKSLAFYVDSEINSSLPNKDWAHYRLASLYLLNKEPENASHILNADLRNVEDKSLLKRIKTLKLALSAS